MSRTYIKKDNGEFDGSLPSTDQRTPATQPSVTVVPADTTPDRKKAARSLQSTEEELAMLSVDEDQWVRAGVALNPNAPNDVLTRLAFDDDYMVRAGVALNPSTNEAVLLLLAADDEPYVRAKVGRNQNVSARIRDLLIEDDIPFVRVAAADGTPEQSLTYMEWDH